MMEGIYYKEWSTALGRDMEFKVYGTAGVPVLAFPCEGGRFYDWENNAMPDAAAWLIQNGRIQLFCADSIDAEGLLNGSLSPRRRAEMQQDGDETPLSEEMEKGDLLAMILSALLVLVPIAIVVLVVLALVGKWVLHL